MEQISEGGRSIHEIEKQRKRLEVEKIQIVIVMYDDNSAFAQLQYMMILSFLNMNCEF